MRFVVAAWLALAVAHAQTDTSAMVPPAGPGVFAATPSGSGVFKLTVAGHRFTSRAEIEKYLAYRAAQLTIEQGAEWFTLTEERGSGETADSVPARDPGAPRYSFRMKYFRPVWRVKTTGSTAWTRWSPFAGAPFAPLDPSAVTDFEVSVEIVPRKGPMDDADPLGFEAHALSDLLVSQVSPPK